MVVYVGDSQEEDFHFSYVDASHNLFQRAVIRVIEFLSGQPLLKRLYEEYRDEQHPHSAFFGEALKRLNIKVNVSPEELAHIPKEGPLVIVANHPFGVLDGLIMGLLAQSSELNFRVLTHSALCQVPELDDYLLPVDFSETREAVQTNLETRRISREILSEGGCIVVFPGGGVSTAKHILDFSLPVDPEWQPFTSHLIKRAKATVLPIHFSGQNGRLFQTVSQFSVTLRSSLLFHEVHRMMGSSVNLRIGTPLPYDELEQHKSRTDLANYLRQVTYELSVD
jgi:putative hemolysin